MAAGTSVRPLKAVLLDIDGTLLDSNEAHTQAWIDALREHGHDVPYAQVRPLIGKGGDKLLDELVGLDDAEGEGQEIADRRRELFLNHSLDRLRPTRGARALVEGLIARGLRPIVATSASGAELDGLLERAGVADLIEAAATSDDAEASKPDPDIIEAALAKAGLAANEALMLGDTPHDIEAAQAAGVATVVLRCGGWWKDASLRGALAVYDDPADLLRQLDHSPFAG